MTRRSTGAYPDNWKAIATQVKEEAGWKCIRCGKEHNPPAGYCLTVHHLDLNLANNVWWNTLALCQRCHLSIQQRVILARPWLLPHSAWFKPYVAGWYAHQHGLPEDRDYVTAHIEELLALGQQVQMKEPA